jgi:hypothetical protein
MSFVDERAIVESAFLNEWDSIRCPVKLDNVTGLVKGTSKVASQDKLAEWCELIINPGVRQEADITSNHRIRSVGTISVNVFVKVGTGTGRARELADAVVSILQLKELASNFATRAGRIVNIGQAEDESFYQMSVQVPYFRDDFQS